MAESEQKLRMCFTSDSFYRISKLELLPAITIRLRIPACITLWVLGLFALIGLHKNFQWTTITVCLEENPDMHFSIGVITLVWIALTSNIWTNPNKRNTQISGRLQLKSAGRQYIKSILTCIVCSLSDTSCVCSHEWSSKWQVGNCLMLAGRKSDELPLLTHSDHY